MFMFFGLGGRVNDSQNQIIFGDTRILKIIQDEIPNHVPQILLLEISK